MASRVSFRPRPLDVNKPLCVVKDLAELDSSDALVSRDVTHNHEALDKNNEEVKSPKPAQNSILTTHHHASLHSECGHMGGCLDWGLPSG